MGLCSSLILLVSGKETRFFLRSVMVGCVWNGFLLGRVRGHVLPCRFCGAPDSDGHLFWDCTFRPLVEIRENPEFHDLMRLDKEHWPWCLLWHGWLSMLFGVNGAAPWAVDASESAAYLVEVALGPCSSGLIADWSPSDEFDHDTAVSSLPDHPDVWTDGSLVLDRLTGVLLQVLGSLLTSLSISGGVIGGVMLMIFVLILMLRLVGVSALFLGLFNLFKGLRCGVLFWPCSPLVRFTLVLTILVLFDMLVGYWAVVVVQSILSLSMMVISFC